MTASVWSTDPIIRAQEQKDWLSEDNIKIIICDIVYHDGSNLNVGYYSNTNYITLFDDEFTNLLGQTTNNVTYRDILDNIPVIVSKIDGDTTLGALEFLNPDGEYDSFLNYAWEGHPMLISIGDPSWIRDDFIPILEGINSNISSTRPNILSLSIRDKRELFNDKIQKTLITTDFVASLYGWNPITETYPDPENAVFKELGTSTFNPLIPIEIKITDLDSPNGLPAYTTSDDGSLASILADYLDSLPDFNASCIDSGSGNFDLVVVDCTVNYGNPENAHDGSDFPDLLAQTSTYFEFNTTEPNGGAQSVDITVKYDSTEGINTARDLNNRFFHIYSPNAKYYVWFNVNNLGIDPREIELEDEAFIPANPDDILIPDTVLNTPVSLLFGHCFNIEPKLIDTANHIYLVSEGPIESIKVVRANGVVIYDIDNNITNLVEVNNEIGCFRLLVHQQNTQITCDVIGINTFATGSTLNLTKYGTAQTIEWIAIEKTTLTSEDICSVAFPYFDSIQNNLIGIYIPDEVDINSVLTQIMEGAGGFIRFGRATACKLQILRLDDPSGKIPILNLGEDNIIEKGIQLGTTEPPKASITLSFRKNWTVQDTASLAGLITNESGEYLNELNLYTTEYSTVVAENSSVIEQFPLAEYADIVESLFCNLNIADYGKAATQTEVDRRINIRSQKRFVYKLDTTAAPFTINLGDVIFLTHNRFGFQYGKNCLVVGLEEYPSNQRVNIEVWL